MRPLSLCAVHAVAAVASTSAAAPRIKGAWADSHRASRQLDSGYNTSSPELEDGDCEPSKTARCLRPPISKVGASLSDSSVSFPRTGMPPRAGAWFKNAGSLAALGRPAGP